MPVSIQQPRMASEWKSSKAQAMEAFFSKPIFQHRRNGWYQALCLKPLKRRHIFPLIKKKLKKKKESRGKKKLPSFIQPLCLYMKPKIRLIPRWSQLTEQLHICHSGLCMLQSASWHEEFYVLSSMTLKCVIDLGVTSIFVPPSFKGAVRKEGWEK